MAGSALSLPPVAAKRRPTRGATARLPGKRRTIRRLPRRRRPAVPAFPRPPSLRSPQHRNGRCLHELESVDHLTRRSATVEVAYRSGEPRIRDTGYRPRGEGLRAEDRPRGGHPLSILARQELAVGMGVWHAKHDDVPARALGADPAHVAAERGRVPHLCGLLYRAFRPIDRRLVRLSRGARLLSPTRGEQLLEERYHRRPDADRRYAQSFVRQC